MKVKSKRQVLQANKIFTDREEPRASFWKNYEKCKSNIDGDGEIRVLTYYGIGGIGKTTLLKKLQEEVKERVTNSKSVYFDFDILQESRGVLEHLRRKLETQYNFQFPLFSVGMYMYARKIGDSVDGEAIKGMVDKDPIMNGVLSAVGCLPLVGFTAKLFMAADRGVAVLKKVLSSHKQEMKDIESKDAGELYSYLPVLFAQDLADNIEDTKEPLVVFLDTYEQLVNEMAVTGESLNNDLWLRGENGLIQNVPNVLWVIAGREKLRWDRFDADWQDSLEQHILGALSENDADGFLNSAGISDKKLREDIFQLTKGTPVYLDLCVDRYMSLVEKGESITIDDFGKNIYTLVERYVRYMDDNKKDIVYMFACLGTWDDEMINEVVPKILQNFSIAAYEKVKDFSFVTKSDDGLYSINRMIRDVLLTNCPQVITDKAKTEAPEYVENKLRAMNVYDSDYGRSVKWMVDFGLRHFVGEGLHEYLKNYVGNWLIAISESAQFNLAETLLTEIEGNLSGKNNKLLQAWCLRYMGILQGERGNYELACVKSKQSQNLYFEILGEEHSDTISAMQELAITLSDLGKYDEAFEMQKQVLAKQKEILGENHHYTINAMTNLASSLRDLGKYDEAFEMQKQVLEKRKEILGEAHPDTISAMRNLANSLYVLGKYDEALEIYKQVLAKRKEILGEDHPYTIWAMSNLASSLNVLGKYDEALEIYKQVLEKRKEILGENHPDTISAMRNLAISLSDLGKYDEALEMKKQVLAKRKEILGENHPDTISAMQGLSNSLSDVGKYDEALEMRKQVLAKRKEILGEAHPDTISAMRNLASSLNALGEYDEALEMKKLVLAKRKDILGEDHPDTIVAMNGVAWGCFLSGKFLEGIPYIEKCLSLGKICAINLKSSAVHRDTQAMLYANVGRTDEAVVIAKELFDIANKDFAENISFVASRNYALAYCLEKAGKKQEALPYAEKAHELRKAELGEENNDTKKAQELVEKIQKEKKRKNE